MADEHIKTIFPNSGQIVYSEALTAGSTDLRPKNFNCLYNGSTQNISVEWERNDGISVQLSNVPAGTFIPGRPIRVTTGNNIVGLIVE